MYAYVCQRLLNVHGHIAKVMQALQNARGGIDMRIPAYAIVRKRSE